MVQNGKVKIYLADIRPLLSVYEKHPAAKWNFIPFPAADKKPFELRFTADVRAGLLHFWKKDKPERYQIQSCSRSCPLCSCDMRLLHKLR